MRGGSFPSGLSRQLERVAVDWEYTVGGREFFLVLQLEEYVKQLLDHVDDMEIAARGARYAAELH